MTATYVYVINAANDTLYVGHTGNLFQRLAAHRREAWGTQIVKVHAQVYAVKAEALEIERDLIEGLEPEFNRQGNPRYMTWDDYLGWIGWAA